MGAFLIRTTIQKFETYEAAYQEMENQYCDASYDGNIIESSLLHECAHVEDGKDLMDYSWKIIST